ncbi:MAG TPA: DUF4157 domain-containing protein [Roseiflexaceae bacterium]|nr:DUF4157 domain-containing protein [Roseiflexaceae bacterium]
MRSNGQTRRKQNEAGHDPVWQSHQPTPAPLPAFGPQPAAEPGAATLLDEQQPAAPGHHFGSISLLAEPHFGGSPYDAPPPSDLDALGGNSRLIAGWLSASFPETGRATIQASLRISAAGDQYEQEADRVADTVMGSRGLPGEPIASTHPSYYIQRAPSGAGLGVAPEVESSIDRMQGGGQPLPAGERDFFERRFGHDFSQIRIHADDHAAQTARTLNARAFTVGNDIAFDTDEYRPGSESGRHLLAHELTHTIQQTGGVATKRVQRKAAEERSLVDLATEAVRNLTESEVAQQSQPPIELNPVELDFRPEHIDGTADAPAVAGSASQSETGSAATAKPDATASTETQPGPAPASATPAALLARVPAAPTPALPVAPPLAASTPPAAQPTEPAVEQTAAAAEATGATSEADKQGSLDGEAIGSDPEAGQEIPPDGQAAGSGEAPSDSDDLIQRSPAGRLIQLAPRSPDADPDFRTVVAGVEAVAVAQQEHDPAQQKAEEASAAAEMPPEERVGAADHIRVDAIAEAAAQPGVQGGRTPGTRKVGIGGAFKALFQATAGQQAGPGGETSGFNKAAFKAAVRARIDQLMPQDPKAMEEMDAGAFDQVKPTVDQQVEAGKQRAQGRLSGEVKQAPDPAAVPGKPVTPLRPNAPGDRPGPLNAAGAVPKAKGPDEVEEPLHQQSKQLDAEMEQGEITPEQIQDSNEPDFQSALAAKNDTQARLLEALPAYRAKEQAQIQSAQAEAGALTEAGLGGMFASRGGTFTQIDGVQGGTKEHDEQRRASIGEEIDAVFQSAKTDVEGILAALDTQVDQVFNSGMEAAKLAAVRYIIRESQAYKARRYNNGSWSPLKWLGGKARQVKDSLFGMPDEYYQYFRQGRDLYIAEMDTALDRVVAVVADHLGRAHQRIQQGRAEIERLVASQPPELQEVARQAAQQAEEQFTELEQSIESKQSDIVNTLAQKYTEKLQEFDSELEKMQEAQRGLLAKAGDLIKGVIKTIAELKDMLISTLRRAGDVILQILKHPIRFLGNLLRSIGRGFGKFVDNIGKHLANGLISWLTGTMASAGIRLPETWDLKGIFSLVLQIFGLSYHQIRSQVVRALGDKGEKVIGAIEQAWEVFQIIQSEGLAGLWDFIQDKVGDLKALVLDQIKELVMEKVIKAGVQWLIGLLGGPAGAFIKAVQAIIRVVSWFIKNAERVAALVNSVLDAVALVVSGDIEGAAEMIEQALGSAVPLLISLLVDLLGLGDIAEKIQEIIGKIRKPIEKAIGWLVDQAVALGKKIWSALGGKEKKSPAEGGLKISHKIESDNADKPCTECTTVPVGAKVTLTSNKPGEWKADAGDPSMQASSTTLVWFAPQQATKVKFTLTSYEEEHEEATLDLDIDDAAYEACQGNNRRSNTEHEMIQYDYIGTKDPGAMREYGIPKAGGSGGMGYADLVSSSFEIYEIKPQGDSGTTQVNRYLTMAKQHCGNKGWHLGTSYPDTRLPYGDGRVLFAHQEKSKPGLIFYSREGKQKQPAPVAKPVPDTDTDRKKLEINVENVRQVLLDIGLAVGSVALIAVAVVKILALAAPVAALLALGLSATVIYLLLKEFGLEKSADATPPAQEPQDDDGDTGPIV